MTNQRKPQKTIQSPKVAMPSGGGAIKGISEPFKAQDFTGSAGFGIPFSLPTARGFDPSVNLQYSSDGGNGVFGLGFSVEQLSISRKTANGIPFYDERDVYMLSGAELVPAYTLSKAGVWTKVERTATKDNVTYHVYTFKPRVEGSFNIIEQWVDAETKISFWKILTGDNQTHYLGLTSNGRIYDAENPEHIFEWLIESSADAHGNTIVYKYKAEDNVNVPSTIYNAGRNCTSQRYIWQIQYGNYFADTPGGETTVFAFTVRFDYGQINDRNPDAPETSWATRPDPFSHYKAGFEVRTYRRCKGIYVQHLFTGENNGQPFTTQGLLLVYRQSRVSNLSLVESIHQRGYKINPDASLWIQDMPPVTLHYQAFEPEKQTWQPLEINAPGYFDQSSFMPVDLYGKGIDGFLLSNETYTGWIAPLGKGQFKPIEPLDHFPTYNNFTNDELTFTSLEGNSVLDLVVTEPGNSGFFATDGDTWQPFEPFQHLPVDFTNPDKEWADIEGSGKAAIVLFDEPSLKHYTAQGKRGYSHAHYTKMPALFPAVNSGGEKALIGFSDFLGDGLSHRFKLTDGRLEVWPNLGHGRFGNMITLGNAPSFDGQFDTKRILLLDTDGSGATDILWLSDHTVTIWFNQNGNAFSEPITLPLPAAYSPLAQVTVGDVTGYGTASLIFTEAAPMVKHFYYDFSGCTKPYLVYKSANGVGATTTLYYTTSVLEQLADEQQGRNWPTRLPFPVHVIQKMETVEEISGAKYIQRFRYHDGYYDPHEREFRGFGYVETWDTDSFEAFQASANLSAKEAALLDKNCWSPPVYTRSWFLTGAYMLTPAICEQYRQEYYSGDTDAWLIPAFELAPEMAAQGAASIQQAYAALAGQAVRTEVYGDDFSELRNNPYTVSQSTSRVRLMQPRLEGQYCVVLVEPVNSLDYNYERNPTDPQISQQCALLFDAYGNALLSASLAYPRRSNLSIHIYPEQQRATCVVSQTDYINTVNVDEDTGHYIGIGWQDKSYEIGGLAWPENAPLAPENLYKQVIGALENQLTKQGIATEGAWSRLLSWQRSFYWNDDETAVLPGGQVNALALLHHSEAMEYTEHDIADVFKGKVSADILEQQGGYVWLDNAWWNTGLVQYYHRREGQFYMPYKTANTEAAKQSKTVGNGLDVKTTAVFDVYMMNMVGIAVHLSPETQLLSTIDWDYQSMQPWQQTDANENVQQFLFDPLGRVIVQSILGTIEGKPVGDSPVSAYNIIEHPVFDEVIASPEAYLQGCTGFYYYDLHAWQNKANPQPTNAITLGRMHHVNDPDSVKATDNKTLIPIGIVYTDGLGRTIQSKARTGPGPITLQKTDGIVATPHAASKSDIVHKRWQVSGRTVYDNKGNAIELYQPFFSDNPYLESQQAIIDQQLVPPPTIMRYDALGRLVRTDSAKGYFSKIVFSPWESASYDYNDTILDSAYYKNFTHNYPANPNLWQQEAMYALQQAIPCYNTPSRVVLDNRGQTIRTIASNLGAITVSSIPQDVVPATYTPQTLWQSLVTKGYLYVDTTNAETAWVSDKFQPYTKDFNEKFTTLYGADSLALQDWLAQACMTTLHVYDIQGNEIMNADPRLFLRMVRTGELLYNCTMQYAFGGALIYSHNVDAGEKWMLGNIYGNAIQSYDSRQFNISISYDRLQRTIAKQVTGGDGKNALNNITEVAVYGDDIPDAANYNLKGNVYQHYDESGLNTIAAYSLGNLPLQFTTQLRADYKKEANWTAKQREWVQQSASYAFSVTYNALNQVINETLPDGSKTFNEYDIASRLVATQQQVNNTAAGTVVNQTVIIGMTYDANGKTTRTQYGNGSNTLHEYDAITQQVIRTTTRRKVLNSEEKQTVIQDLFYTYDPNGNLCSTMDGVSEVVYNNNQKIIPKNRYTYDPLYRLTAATGRALTGLNGQKKNATAEHVLTPLGNEADLQSVENYTQQYRYDFSANLLVKKHVATSGNRTQQFEYSDASNRLLRTGYGHIAGEPMRAPLTYDANGNLLELEQGDTAVISWNYNDNIGSVTQIVRETENASINDAEYYVYNSSGIRIRKVTERLQNNGSVLAIVDKIYLRGYEISRTYTMPIGIRVNNTAALPTPQSERISINASALITHVWTIVDSVMGVKQAGEIQYRFQLQDPLDSVTIELTEDASLLTFEQYYPYGGTSFMLARNHLEAASKEYRFCGKERDAATGLYYYGARYYSTTLIRWMCPDPAGTVDGLNLYLYVGSNPIGYNDPMGTDKRKAQKYFDKNKIKEDATHASVEKFVNDHTNKKAHRKGVLDAWNEGQTGRYIITPTSKIKPPKRVAAMKSNIKATVAAKKMKRLKILDIQEQLNPKDKTKSDIVRRVSRAGFLEKVEAAKRTKSKNKPSNHNRNVLLVTVRVNKRDKTFHLRSAGLGSVHPKFNNHSASHTEQIWRGLVSSGKINTYLGLSKNAPLKIKSVYSRNEACDSNPGDCHAGCRGIHLEDMGMSNDADFLYSSPYTTGGNNKQITLTQMSNLYDDDLFRADDSDDEVVDTDKFRGKNLEKLSYAVLKSAIRTNPPNPNF